MPPSRSNSARARTTVADLVDAGLLSAGDGLYFSSSRVTVTADGQLQAADGRRFTSPTDAATVLSGSIRNGWDCWRLGEPTGIKIKELRSQFEQRPKDTGDPTD
jgi:hypothetical protein